MMKLCFKQFCNSIAWINLRFFLILYLLTDTSALSTGMASGHPRNMSFLTTNNWCLWSWGKKRTDSNIGSLWVAEGRYLSRSENNETRVIQSLSLLGMERRRKLRVSLQRPKLCPHMSFASLPTLFQLSLLFHVTFPTPTPPSKCVTFFWSFYEPACLSALTSTCTQPVMLQGCAAWGLRKKVREIIQHYNLCLADPQNLPGSCLFLLACFPLYGDTPIQTRLVTQCPT